MKVSCTRDSLAIGDDADAPHETLVELPDPATVADLVVWLAPVAPRPRWPAAQPGALRVSGRVTALLADGTTTRVELVGDQTAPVAAADRVHLEYLLADDLDRMTDFAHEDPLRTDLRSLARYSDDR